MVSLLLGVCFQVLYQDVIVAGDVRNAIVERFPGATFSLAPWQEQRKGGGKEIPPLVPKESPPESWSTGNRVGPRGEGAGSINQEIDRERESDRGSHLKGAHIRPYLTGLRRWNRPRPRKGSAAGGGTWRALEERSGHDTFAGKVGEFCTTATSDDTIAFLASVRRQLGGEQLARGGVHLTFPSADPSTLVAPETGELSHFETAGPATARPIGTRAERLGRRERAHLLLRHRRGPGYTHVTHTCTVASS
ncbi:hypothetical protein GW17_00023772 [Ensete ventricosum]|nr:hypothetical protein GW17_00023772 [Ensete ventricosum]